MPYKILRALPERRGGRQCHFQGNVFVFERTTLSSRHMGNSLNTCENYDELCEL